MDIAARFTALVQAPEPAVPLDEVALLVAAHADPSVDVASSLRALDDLASGCGETDLGGLLSFMTASGFTGNRTDYYDERNSYLHEVLARRTGIPITLSVVMIEVGRRIGVPIVGIGLPGHFVVRAAEDRDAFADPYNGVMLDRAACERLVEGPVDDAAFAPVGAYAIVARMLANLKAIHLTKRDRRALARVLELRVVVPGVPAAERRELASTLASDGRFLEAAAELDQLATIGRSRGDAAIVEEAERGAVRLRARLN
jgi:regulator of sirC expression with transglutaminase-like and TPR domain